MNKNLILGIVLMFLLVACAPSAAPPTPPEVKVVPTVEKVVEEAVPEPEVGRAPPPRALPSERVDTTTTEVVVEEKQEMSPQLRDLLKRHVDKIKTFRALPGGTVTNNLFLDTYFWLVKDGQVTKTKIKKYEESYYVRAGYYDTVYVDLKVGCCEDPARCKSHNVDNTGQKFDVDVSSLNMIKSPIEWIKEVPANAQIVGPQTFDQRSVTFIKFDRDGTEVQMWVDSTYGLPLKVVEVKNGQENKIQFNDPIYNDLAENDFDAPCD